MVSNTAKGLTILGIAGVGAFLLSGGLGGASDEPVSFGGGGTVGDGQGNFTTVSKQPKVTVESPDLQGFGGQAQPSYSKKSSKSSPSYTSSGVSVSPDVSTSSSSPLRFAKSSAGGYIDRSERQSISENKKEERAQESSYTRRADRMTGVSKASQNTAKAPSSSTSKKKKDKEKKADFGSGGFSGNSGAGGGF